jgi:hypothetical protein
LALPTEPRAIDTVRISIAEANRSYTTISSLCRTLTRNITVFLPHPDGGFLEQCGSSIRWHWSVLSRSIPTAPQRVQLHPTKTFGALRNYQQQTPSQSFSRLSFLFTADHPGPLPTDKDWLLCLHGDSVRQNVTSRCRIISAHRLCF